MGGIGTTGMGGRNFEDSTTIHATEQNLSLAQAFRNKRDPTSDIKTKGHKWLDEAQQ